MKVLIFDDNSSRKELIALISLYSVEIKVEGTDDPKKFLDHYSKNNIVSHSSIFDLIELLNGEDIQYEVEKDYIQVLQKG